MQINELPLDAGAVFERTYNILTEKMQSAINKLVKGDESAKLDAALLISIAVNGAFATELYMKAILPDGTRGHKLNELYSQLPQDVQRNIMTRTVSNMLTLPGVKEYDNAKFGSDIVTMGNSFVDWRYFYQNNPAKANPQFYKALMMAVRTVAFDLKNNKEDSYDFKNTET